MAKASEVRSVRVTPAVLRRMPLPQPGAGGDKDTRGRVLIVGGAREMPGAIILAATAALRAGAGKLQVATARSIAPFVALALPEARVFGLPEIGPAGDIAPEAADEIAERAQKNDAVLLGPGMVDEESAAVFVTRLAACLSEAGSKTTLVLDAAALSTLKNAPDVLHRLNGRVILTPHAGEAAGLLGDDKEKVTGRPAETATRAARERRAVFALKGTATFITGPGADDTLYRNEAGNVGLATSGSGDTLAGIVAGLAARGAVPLQAAVWGVYLHAKAGDRMAEQVGPLGFLARELLGEVPRLMATLARPAPKGKK
jgi:hydroxyethylthiazole kinase-like uncharacterized protein yjeF